jgi:hypothetical protein
MGLNPTNRRIRVFSNKYRPAAALIAAAAMAAACAACGSSTDPASSTTSSPGSSSATAHIADCDVKAPGPSNVDNAFANVPGLSVDHICPADVDPLLAAHSTEFLAENAGKLTQDGSPVLSAFAGQTKSGAGDLSVRTFLDDLGSHVAPKTLATEAKNVGSYPVTYFNVPSGVEGFAYFEGPTVVIAYNLAGGSKTGVAEDALAKILANVFPRP